MQGKKRGIPQEKSFEKYFASSVIKNDAKIKENADEQNGDGIN